MLKLNKTMLISPDRLTEYTAWSGHIPFAGWLIEEMKPNTFVELGSHAGDSYLAICQAVAANALNTRCYAVDTWQGDEHAGYYENRIYESLQTYNQAHYANFSTLLRMTFDEALGQFEDGSVDLLHIDGLHTYEAVKHDFETWLPKVSANGIILFHDINVHERGFGVHTLWSNLRERYPTIEFHHSSGLGVLFMNAEAHPQILEQLTANSNFTRNLFAQLGGYITQQRLSKQLDSRLEEVQRKLKETRSKLKLYRNPLGAAYRKLFPKH